MGQHTGMSIRLPQTATISKKTVMKFNNPLSPLEYEERVTPREEDIRGPYFRDQTAIIHSMPFRRLKHKAQVFFSPQNDHICTRIEHALHVATIGATIARGLHLDINMAYAIGLGHDLGHAPFGHAGEKALNAKCHDIGGFIHEIHGLRVANILGNRGKGLNLTYGVRDGIVCHCGEAPEQELSPRKEKIRLEKIKKKDKWPCSWEGCIARIADRIAYLGRDLEDSIEGGFLERAGISIPPTIEEALGETNGEIIDTLVIDVIETSLIKGKVSFSDSKYKVLMDLAAFSETAIYKHDEIVRYRSFCERIVKEIFKYLVNLYNRWDFDITDYFSSPSPLDKSGSSGVGPG